MKSVLVIGIGRFGSHLCRRFSELGNEVMAVDSNEEAVESLAGVCTSVQVGDCTRLEVLESLGVSNFDLCFVCIGNDFRSSLIITAQLKDLGAQKVISKAGSELHEKFLMRNGADVTLYAERDMAEKTAMLYSSNGLHDYMALTANVSVYELVPKPEWIGKTVAEMDFRNKYKLTILAVKRGEEVFPMPGANYVFKDKEVLMVMGGNEDAERLLATMKS